MDMLDNKKKRDQKSSEIEKELALAHLQDLFLGSKAPKADFLVNTPITVSPALLPKDKVQLTLCETSKNFGDPQLPLSFCKIKVKGTSVQESKKMEDSSRSPVELSNLTEPEIKPTFSKPLTSFDLLAVGLDPVPEKTNTTQQKTKSFLAHFAKKDSEGSKDKK